MQLYNSVQRKI